MRTYLVGSFHKLIVPRDLSPEALSEMSELFWDPRWKSSWLSRGVGTFLCTSQAQFPHL